MPWWKTDDKALSEPVMSQFSDAYTSTSLRELTRWGWNKMAATLADDIFKCNFVNENVLILINISLNFVPKGPIDNKSSMVQVMAWCWKGDEPLHESMMTQFNDAYIRLQWVNSLPSEKFEWNYIYICTFLANANNWYLRYLLWSCP